MSAVSAPLPLNASPSDRAAAGSDNAARVQQVDFSKVGTLAAAIIEKRHYFTQAGVLTAVHSFRRTKAAGGGEGGSTDVDVNLNGTSILAATKMEHEFSSGQATRVDGVLDSAHAAYSATLGGIVVAVGDYLEAEIDAIEAGGTAPLGLYVNATVRVG